MREDQPTSERLISQVRLIRAMIKLWRRVVGHNHWEGTSQVVGTSIRVGRRIFSTVGGLSFVGDRSRGCGR